MKIGDLVDIKNTGMFWDGKRGKVESLDEEKNTATVLVNFIPEENKNIRQDFSLNFLEPINANESLNEESEDDREIDLANDELNYNNHIREDLAKYFDVDIEDVEHTHGNYFIVEDREYFVGTQDEAYEAAVANARETLDEMGLEALTAHFKEYVLDNFLDRDTIEDDIDESNRYYADDIEDESDSTFANRLISEMYDAQILTDDDFDVDEDGEILYDTVNYEVDLDEKKEEFIDYLNRNTDFNSFVKDMYDAKTIEERGLIDFDAVAEECVAEDGVAHYLASYDGDELEIRDDLFAYRCD